MTYSFDLRKRVIDNVINFKLSVNDASIIFIVNRSTIYRWIKAYYNGTLYDKTIRTPKITIPIKEFIKKYVIKRTNFSYIVLLKMIHKVYDVIISRASLYNALKEQNISKKKIYIKPFYMNPLKYKHQLQSFKTKINSISQNKIISIDETSVDTHIDHNYGWSKKGKKIIKRKTKQRIRYTIICGVTNKKIIHYNIIKGSANGEHMLTFIKDIANKIKTKHYLLLDNARVHHYGKLKDYVNNHKNIEFIYNIAYSPEYNPIEYLFNEFKNHLRKRTITNKNIKKHILKCMTVKKYHFQKYFKKSLTF